MANMCSAHQSSVPVPGCGPCNCTPGDVFGHDVWAEMVAMAEAAGEVACEKCKFKFYLTTDTCPLCSTKYQKKAL